jgi:hypothetical protein
LLTSKALHDPLNAFETLLKKLTPEQRRKGLPPEELLARLPPEQRLQGLSREQFLSLLPMAEIENYLN